MWPRRGRSPTHFVAGSGLPRACGPVVPTARNRHRGTYQSARAPRRLSRPRHRPRRPPPDPPRPPAARKAVRLNPTENDPAPAEDDDLGTTAVATTTTTESSPTFAEL